MSHAPATEKYYVPHESKWPIIASAAFFTLLLGVVALLNHWLPAWAMLPGFALVVYMFIGWFGDVIKENNTGMYGLDVDRSFRMGMMWFIFSEVMFFAAFFGALFYARVLAVPWLGGEGTKVIGNELLHGTFENAWPTNGPAALSPRDDGTFEIIPAFGLPAVNTVILLLSGVTVTIAHHALRAGKRGVLNIFWPPLFCWASCSSIYRVWSMATPTRNSASRCPPASTAPRFSCSPASTAST